MELLQETPQKVLEALSDFWQRLSSEPVAPLAAASVSVWALLGCCSCLLVRRLLRSRSEGAVTRSASIEMRTLNWSDGADDLEEPGRQSHSANDYRVKVDAVARIPSTWSGRSAQETDVDAQPSTGWGRYSLTGRLRSDRSQISTSSSQVRSILKGASEKSTGLASQGTLKSNDSRVSFPEEHKLTETIEYTPDEEEDDSFEQGGRASDPDEDDDADPDDWEAFRARMRAWSQDVLKAGVADGSEAADAAGSSEQQEVGEGVG